jgi:tetratricopeptide (TPR) repeat protein
MSSAFLERGLLLYDQGRYPQAEEEFRQAIAANPQEAHPRAMLGLCLVQRERFAEAEAEVEQAIHLAPDLAWAHYARAHVLFHRNDYRKARQAIQEAIRLDPGEVENHSLLSSIELAERKWNEALAAAEKGLSLDPEHVQCTNLRAIAMVKLGRRDEAGQTIDAALARAPEDSTTHANKGWTFLEMGQVEKALEHFRESLRLDPQNEWAQQGILEALKARNFIYALMLRYFLWMSRLSSGAQWGILLAGWFGNRMLTTYVRNNPESAPFLLPIKYLYIGFVLLTWTARPLFNLLLRLDRFGRLVLSKEQKLEANMVGGCIGLALLFVVAGLALNWKFFVGSGVLAAMAIPIPAVFSCQRGWPRKTMTVLAVGLVLLGILAISLVLRDLIGAGRQADLSRAAWGLVGLYAIGIFLSSWIANFLAQQTPKR